MLCSVLTPTCAIRLASFHSACYAYLQCGSLLDLDIIIIKIYSPGVVRHICNGTVINISIKHVDRSGRTAYIATSLKICLKEKKVRLKDTADILMMC